jgi:hypothetical protein
MKTIQTLVLCFFLTATVTIGEISDSPWKLAKSAMEWSAQNADQVIADSAKIEFIISNKKDSSKLVAISSATRKKESKNALREFAIGIRKSFTKNGVVDLKESTATRWNVKGIRMVFSIPTEDSKVNCDAFFLRQGDRFWAVMAFGPDQEKLAAAHDALIKK